MVAANKVLAARAMLAGGGDDGVRPHLSIRLLILTTFNSSPLSPLHFDLFRLWRKELLRVNIYVLYSQMLNVAASG